jgi:kynurenine formamidase
MSKEWNLGDWLKGQKSVPGGLPPNKPLTKHACHKREIPRGKTGEFSKITEEYHEALDAFEQGNIVMLLIEFSDLFGAVEKFLEKYHPSISIEQIVRQAKATNELFKRGVREDRDHA